MFHLICCCFLDWGYGGGYGGDWGYGYDGGYGGGYDQGYGGGYGPPMRGGRGGPGVSLVNVMFMYVFCVNNSAPDATFDL